MSLGVFRASAEQYTPIGFRIDDDGKGWVMAYCHANLVADTPYKVTAGAYGYVTEAIASGTCYAMIGFPNQAWTTNDSAWLQVQGYKADAILTSGTTYTSGYYITFVAGAYTNAATDNVAGQFAVAAETATGGAYPNIMLTQTGYVNVTS